MIALEGEWTVHTIMALLPQGYGLIDAAKETVVLDLSKVSRVDSGSIALLIEWLRYAKNQGKILRFENLPEKMQQMMAVSNLSLN